MAGLPDSRVFDGWSMYGCCKREVGVGVECGSTVYFVFLFVMQPLFCCF